MKLTYSEIMAHVKEDKTILTPAHIKVIKKALEESDLDATRKELELINIKELEESIQQ